MRAYLAYLVRKTLLILALTWAFYAVPIALGLVLRWLGT